MRPAVWFRQRRSAVASTAVHLLLLCHTVRVDELIYVSSSKLAQFIPIEQSRWRRLRLRKLVAGFSAGGAKLEVETETADINRLAAVIRELEESARWYEDDLVMPGEWVFFEGKLAFVRTQAFEGELGSVDDGVLFFDSPRRGHPRLLLHGSARHLTDDRIFGVDLQPSRAQSCTRDVDLPLRGNYVQPITAGPAALSASARLL